MTLEALIPTFDQGFDDIERGDLERFRDIARTQVHPECEFRSAIGSVVGGGSYEGPDGITSWFEDLIENTSERHWRNRRYEIRDDVLLIFLADLEFIGAASQVRVEEETGAVFEYRDGLCVRIDSFLSHADALEFAEARVA